MPDILGDYNIWRETHWTEAQMHTQPDTWLTKIMMAHAESARIEAELYDEAYRFDPQSRENRGRPIDDADVAELRARNPRYAHLPDAAIKKMFRKRR